MTSIMPLQNPQRRNNELTIANVNITFRPSLITNMLSLSVIHAWILLSCVWWSGV